MNSQPREKRALRDTKGGGGEEINREGRENEPF